jgi:hypothetical protein
MKIKHIEVRRFISKPYFSSLHPLLQPYAYEKQVRAYPVGTIPCPVPLCLRFYRKDSGFRDKRPLPQLQNAPITRNKWLFYRFCVRLWNSEEPISRIIHDLGYSKVWARWGRPFYPGLLQQMKPGSIILSRRQKGAGQGMVPTGHTHTCFSLAEGCRSGLRLCEKNWVWTQTFSLEYVIFSWFYMNICCGKTWGIAFWAILV